MWLENLELLIEGTRICEIWVSMYICEFLKFWMCLSS